MSNMTSWLIEQIKTTSEKVIEVKMYYRKEGNRGFFFSAQPMKISTSGGITMREFDPMEGYQKFLLSTPRYSDKARIEALNLLNNYKDAMVKTICQNCNLELLQPEKEAKNG